MTTEITKTETPEKIDWNDPIHYTQPKRIFNVKFDGFSAGDAFDLDFTVEITVSDMVLHEINNFWSYNESRLMRANGSITIAVMRLLANRVLNQCLESYDTIDGVNLVFKSEGWFDRGFKITKLDWEWMIDQDDFKVTEVQSPEEKAAVQS